MKKLLSGIVTIVVLVALATSVNASSISANKTEANKGDTVTVTVGVKETHSIGTWLKYDSSKFEFVSASSSIGELTTGNANGVVKIAGTSTDKTTTPGTETKDTTDTNKKDTTNTGKKDTTNKKVNDEGKTITKLPQTGASVVVIAGIALTAVAGIFVARKISK